MPGESENVRASLSVMQRQATIKIALVSLLFDGRWDYGSFSGHKNLAALMNSFLSVSDMTKSDFISVPAM